MFFNGIKNNYNIDEYEISVRSGVPKQYYYIKNKKFNDWEIPPWELIIFRDRLIGQGTYSNVYLAKWRETFVVAKVFKPEIMESKKFLFIREIQILSKIHHPNIVQFLGYIDKPFIIVMEYIPNNNLSYNIKSLKKKEKISIVIDILRALAYLHNRQPFGLIHRDIKPTNIILTKSKIAKIADFGLSKFYLKNNMTIINKQINNLSNYNNNSDLNSNNNSDLNCNNNSDLNSNNNSDLNYNNNSDLNYNNNSDLNYNNNSDLNSNNNSNIFNNSNVYNVNNNNDLTSDVGTRRYMAPEIIESSTEYTNNIDIYSCGILFYEMFENKKFINKNCIKWFWTPNNIKKIILNNMICDDPTKRLSAIQLIKIFKYYI